MGRPKGNEPETSPSLAVNIEKQATDIRVRKILRAGLEKRGSSGGLAIFKVPGLARVQVYRPTEYREDATLPDAPEFRLFERSLVVLA